jgi:hypothetical protein
LARLSCTRNLNLNLTDHDMLLPSNDLVPIRGGWFIDPFAHA